MASTMNFTPCSPDAALDRQLRAARARAFIGREAELVTFGSMLTDRTETFTVLYLHGPGGIGKSTLLLRFADEALATGRPVGWLDPGPDQTGPTTADPADPPVVLIDDLDRRTGPEQWLRHTVLPTFPAGTLFVVASRRPPSVTWRADLGWHDILRPLPVGPLSPAAATALLNVLDVPAERQESVIEVGRGNPLALRVAADSDVRTEEDLRRGLALSIYHPLIGDIPSPAHRHALEICAHASTTNEDLLRAAVPDADADPAELFAWLRDLPFVASNPRGVFPSDVVRQVVETELRWRDADYFAAMHRRVKEHLIGRARGVAADAVLPFVADVLFVRRAEVRPYLTRLDGFEVREDRYEPADREGLLDLTLATEGPESARLVAFWLDRQPEAVRVYRRPGERTAIGFFALLRLSRPADDELGADPVVAAAWSRAQNVMPLRPGEYLSIARFAIDPGAYWRPSEAMDLAQLRVAGSIMRDDQLAWSVIASPDPDYWAPAIERSHARTGGPPITVDGRPYTLFSRYLGAPPDLRSGRPASIPAAPHAATTTWTRAEFDHAVRHALQAWRRPDVFADSRLLGSRMVAEAGDDDPMAALRRIFSAALETLRNDPQQAKFHRVLVGTYLEGAPTQEAAAERLGLPISTYRRHLARGLTGLRALLWKAETHGIGLLGSESAPS
jgi:hypothetical protein